MNRDSFMRVFEYLDPPMWIYSRHICRAALRAGNEMMQYLINKNVNKAAYLLANSSEIMKDKWNLCFICKTIIFDDDKSCTIKCRKGCGRLWCDIHSDPSYTKLAINLIPKPQVAKVSKRQQLIYTQTCCFCYCKK